MNTIEGEITHGFVNGLKSLGVIAFLKLAWQGGSALVKKLGSNAQVEVSKQVALDNAAMSFIDKLQKQLDSTDVKVAGLVSRLDIEEEKRKYAEVQADVATLAREDAEKALSILKEKYDTAQLTIAALKQRCSESELLEIVLRGDIAKAEVSAKQYEARIKALTDFIASKFPEELPAIILTTESKD